MLYYKDRERDSQVEKDITDKRRADVSEGRIAGLKRHQSELNRLVIESLQGSLLYLIGKTPYERITITQLCKKAGVSRMAFYGNFTSKDEILKSIITGLQRQLIDRVGSPFRQPVTKDWYIGLFELLKENADVLQRIFEAGFQSKYLELINEILQSYEYTETEDIYLRLIWCGGIVNAVIYWLSNGLKETPEMMAEMCGAFLKSRN